MLEYLHVCGETIDNNKQWGGDDKHYSPSPPPPFLLLVLILGTAPSSLGSFRPRDEATNYIKVQNDGKFIAKLELKTSCLTSVSAALGANEESCDIEDEDDFIHQMSTHIPHCSRTPDLPWTQLTTNNTFNSNLEPRLLPRMG